MMKSIPFIQQRCFRVFAHSYAAHFVYIQTRSLFAVIGLNVFATGFCEHLFTLL